MSIFDFFDDDEDGEIVELRSTAAPTIASSSQSTVIKDEPLPIEKNKNVQQSQNRGRPSRKSTVNEVPLNTLCCECQKLGTAENATDCDKCKKFLPLSMLSTTVSWLSEDAWVRLDMPSM